ncbi:hypothetical protein DFR70_102552 [Nocardia tenerifensis]|uniref:Uncharacterized protein n=1 Tax=Nocardia tenerifensis TaxID=228006 RepID=A0A318KBJ1_9NOCA|nr:hypothetical protein [Nocardia tenerifensis]PXX68866.1 hypothetical protein DFR70_102552 [Nocardia tenerifensis]
MAEIYRVLFPEGYDGRREAETADKGWLDVEVVFADGSIFPVSFYDPLRLRQTIEDEIQGGSLYYTEPNLVILSKVTPQNIRLAIDDMVETGFFANIVVRKR